MTQPISECFCFFPRADFGGGERVHSEILAAAGQRVTAVHYDDASEACPVADLAQEINPCRRPLVFGGASKRFYELLPFLDSHVVRVDILHAEGLDMEAAAASAPYLDHRVLISKALFAPLAALYERLDIPLDLLSRLLHIENRTPVPPHPPVKKYHEPLRLIFVGRGCKEKRPQLVGAISRMLAPVIDGFELDIVGDLAGWLGEGELPRCRVHGRVTDRAVLDGLYDAAHIIVCTSLSEGFPLAVSEAMARGVVPVCTNVGGLHQHVLHERTGLLVNAKDEDEILQGFVECIALLNGDRRLLEDLSRNARARAEKKFGGDAFVRIYRQLFSTGTATDSVDPPLATFIVCVRDDFDAALRTILTLKSQTSGAWQLVIVDNDSSPEHGERIKKFECDERIRVIRNAGRIDDTRSLAKGAAWSDGEWIVFPAPGVCFHAGTVELLAEESRDAELVVFRRVTRGTVGRAIRPEPGSVRIRDTDLVFARRSLYETAGCLDPGFAGLAYSCLVQGLLTCASVVAVVEEPGDKPLDGDTHEDESKRRRGPMPVGPGRALLAYRCQGTVRRGRAENIRLLYRGFLESLQVDDRDSASMFLRLMVGEAPLSPAVRKLQLGWLLVGRLTTLRFSRTGKHAHRATADADGLPIVYSAGDPRIQHNTGHFNGVAVVCRPGTDAPAHCVFGPDHVVPSDRDLRVEFDIALMSEVNETGNQVTLDVFDNRSDTILHIEDIPGGVMRPGRSVYSLEFPAEAGQILEFRVYWHGGCAIAVHGMRVRAASGRPGPDPGP